MNHIQQGNGAKPLSINLIYGMLLFVVTIWGVNVVLLKYLVGYIAPSALAAIRIPVAATFLLPAAVYRYGWMRLTKTAWLFVGAAGLFSIVLHQLALSWGVTATSGTHASLILGLNPLATTLLASRFANEPFTLAKGAGVIFGLSGVLLIVTGGSSSTAATLWGDVLILLAMLTYVIGSLFIKKGTRFAPPLVVTAYSHVFAATILMPLAYITDPAWIIGDIAQFWPVTALLFSGWICTGLGAYWWNTAIHHVGASVSSLFLNIMPVVGLFSAMFLLGEHLAARHYIALILVLLGVLLGTGAIRLPQRSCAMSEE